MIKAHMNQESAVPWWAAFGAPLIGVPIVIGLLVLSAPSGAEGARGSVEAGLVGDAVEAVEVEAARTISDREAAAPVARGVQSTC